MAASFKQSPFRAVRFGPSDTVVERSDSGSLILKSPHALGPYARRVTEPLARWAAECPDRTFLAERTPAGPWRRLSYGEAYVQARAIGHEH